MAFSEMLCYSEKTVDVYFCTSYLSSTLYISHHRMERLLKQMLNIALFRGLESGDGLESTVLIFFLFLKIGKRADSSVNNTIEAIEPLFKLSMEHCR